jgi:hypothetical protein
VKVTAHITRRRLIYVAVAVFVVLTVLSFVLPYVGGGPSHGHVTTIP